MKKIILSQLLISLLFIATSFGQTEKGSLLLGGNGSLSLKSSRNSGFDSHKIININPNFGYFIKDNLVIGIKTPLYLEGYNSDIFSFGFGINAFSRYYFAKTEKTSFFGSANYGLNTYQSEGFSSHKMNEYSAGIGLGFTYFLTKSIGFETELQYDYSKNFDNRYGEDNFGMNFGFQIYFNKPKK